tara:strand:- start:717 stop:3905 length:3189 start_codon:yes stop_codon:yes gene_type:complete
MASPILKFKRGNFSNLPGLQAGEPALTVDKFDLYVGIDSTTSNNKFIGSQRFWTVETATTGSGVNLVEGSNNGSNYITLKAPANIAGNQSYEFPSAAVNGGFLRSNASGTLTWDTGSGFNAGSLPLSALDIDGGTDIGADIVDADLFIVDDGAGGTNRKTTASRMKSYFLGGGAGANFTAINVSGITTAGQLDATTLKVSGISTFTGVINGNLTGNVTGNTNGTHTGSLSGATAGTLPALAIDLDGATDIGGAIADADLFLVDDGAGGANKKTAASRIKSYVLGGGAGANFASIKVSGITTAGQLDATTLKVSGISTFTGTVDINGAIDADGGANIAGGETVLSSATVSDLTDNRVVIAGSSGALEDSGNLTFDGTTLAVTGAATVDNLSLNGNTVTTTSGNLTLDSAGGTTTIADDTIISGNLTVNGTQTVVNSTTMSVDDKNLELGTGAADDAAANGGGITIVSGDGNKTFQFEATGDNLGSSENLNIASGKAYKINNTSVLNATTLGSAVVNSSLTSVGTLTALTVSGATNIDATTQSTSNTTGALIVDGGVGVAKNVHVGGTLDVDGQLTSAAPLRNSTGAGLIAGVGAIKNTGSAGLVTAFKFTGNGIDTYTVADGIAHVATTGVAATTFTTSQTTTATQGQTAFTVTAGYSNGFVDVYQNGVRLITGTDYTQTNSNTITLAAGATVGDEIETVAWKSLGDIVNINSVNVVENLKVTGITTSGGVTLSSGAFTGSGSGLTSGTVPISSLDIDGGTATTTLADADLFIVDDGAGGTNRKVTFEKLSDSILGGSGGATFAAVNVTGITTVGGVFDANGGANISGGETVLSSATVSDLTDNRVVIAGSSGALEDSGNLTFNGSTLAVTGNVTANNGATITGAETTLSSATVSDLTDNRVVIAGTSGALEDSNNLQFDGSTLAVTGNITASANVTVSGNLTVNGTTSQINTTNTTIEDTMLELQKVDGGNLSSDTNKDVGIVMNYYSGSAKKAAFYWDDSTARFVVSAVATESSGVMTNSTSGGFEIGSLYLNDCAGTSQVISCSGTTRSLENINVDGGTF